MSDAAEFFAAHDLAGLPGIPKTVSGTIRWLRKNNITSREVPGRGGPGGKRTEFSVAELPVETRAALAERLMAAVRRPAAPLDREAAQLGAAEGAKLLLGESLAERAIETARIGSLKTHLKVAGAMRANAEQRVDAKLAILRAREQFQRAGRLSTKASEFHFAAAYNDGKVEIEAWVRGRYPMVSPSSLAAWRRAVKGGQIADLAGKYGNRKGDGVIDRQPRLRDFVIGMLVETPHARATHIEKAIVARLGDTVKVPALRSIERWIGAWRKENAEVVAALSNPDAWKSKYMPAFGSMSEGIERLNQLWEEDSTPGDVMLLDGRHVCVGGIDIYSRAPRILVTKTSKAEAVAALNRRMLLDLGVPEAVKTDNGADYKSKHVTRVFSALAIAQEFCPPFSPWLKPHIERFFGTFARDLVELLAGFIGHNVAEREAIRARQSFADRLMTKGEVVEVNMTAVEFQEFCDSWIENVYMHQPHDGLAGKTPFEVVAGWTHPVRRIDDERALDVLLGEGVWRVVQKKGIEIDGAWFIAPELADHIGTRVLCLQLPDVGQVVVQGGAELAFVCIAECPERTGISRKEVAAVARQRSVARVQEKRRELKAIARRERTGEIVDEILADRARKARKVAGFPKPALVHDSAGLAAAADAVAELHRAPRSTAELMSDDQARAERARVEQLVPAGNDNELARHRMKGGAISEVAPVFENTYERVIWLFRKAKTRALTNEEQEALAAYKQQQPASYRQLLAMVDEQLAAPRDESGGAQTA